MVTMLIFSRTTKSDGKVALHVAKQFQFSPFGKNNAAKPTCLVLLLENEQSCDYELKVQTKFKVPLLYARNEIIVVYDTMLRKKTSQQGISPMFRVYDTMLRKKTSQQGVSPMSR